MHALADHPLDVAALVFGQMGWVGEEAQALVERQQEPPT